MDLFGLSPDEISRIANSRMDTGGLEINALKALADINYRQAQEENIRNPKTVDMEFGGRTFTVRLEDVPQAMSAGARYMEVPSRIATEKARQAAQYAAAQRSMAGANLSNVQAGRIQHMLPYDIEAQRSLATQRESQTDLNKQKYLDMLARERAMAELGDTPLSEIGDITAQQAARIHPSGLTAGMRPNDDYIRRMREHMDALSKTLVDEKNPALIDSYNEAAIKIKSNTMMFDRGKGKGESVRLPPSVTATDVYEESLKRNISVQQILEDIIQYNKTR